MCPTGDGAKHREARSGYIPIYKHQHITEQEEGEEDEEDEGGRRRREEHASLSRNSSYAAGTEMGGETGRREEKEREGGGSRHSVYRDMYGKQTCKFFRLTQVAWTCSLIV